MSGIDRQVVIIGAGIGGLTTGALLAAAGYRVTVLEAQTYPGGCAGTFYHQGYRFETGATVAGGFQPGGPHDLIGKALDIEWPVKPHDPAWVVHLPGHEIPLTRDYAPLLEQFPETAAFWEQQSRIADLGWSMSAQGLPWPPTDAAEMLQLLKTGLRHFPRDLRLVRYAFASVNDWLKRHQLDRNPAFLRFVDSQLLISAQSTSEYVNAVYGATALDLARQGTFHIEGGIGNLAEMLVKSIEQSGGEVLYRYQVTGFEMAGDRVTGVYARKGKRSTRQHHFPCDFVVANLTPGSLDTLLAEDSPQRLRQEVENRQPGQGAFVLHLGIKADQLPALSADHHQMLATLEQPLGEGSSIYLSLSPEWDASRAPEGYRAASITTHTRVQQWWDLLERDPQAYGAEKEAYTGRMLNLVERYLPGFKNSVEMILPGTPVTYAYYTDRHLGMVGGFPQTSLFAVRGPRTGVPNIRLVGDSIFPGQSTAGVSVGAMRVADQVKRLCPLPAARRVHATSQSAS